MQSSRHQTNPASEALSFVYGIDIDAVDHENQATKSENPYDWCDKLRLVPYTDGSVDLCLLFEMSGKTAEANSNCLHKLLARLQMDLKTAGHEHYIHILMLEDNIIHKKKSARLWDHRLHLAPAFVTQLIATTKEDRVKFKQFVTTYNALYRYDLFANPKSRMRLALDSGEIRNMRDVEEHIQSHPSSRSAQALSCIMLASTPKKSGK